MNEKIVFEEDDVFVAFPRVRNWFTAQRIKYGGEVNCLPSETVPDQTMTMREIVNRFSRGLPINASQRQDAFYDEDSDFPDTSRMDLAELQELRMQYQDELNLINSRLKANEDAKNKSKEASGNVSEA